MRNTVRVEQMIVVLALAFIAGIILGQFLRSWEVMERKVVNIDARVIALETKEQKRSALIVAGTSIWKLASRPLHHAMHWLAKW